MNELNSEETVIEFMVSDHTTLTTANSEEDSDNSHSRHHYTMTTTMTTYGSSGCKGEIIV